ncbi:MAG TPA: BON domain-containing protein [Pseudomonadales bacterium]|nr:BON domain-containing protein [Pseudomonadales bacterium]
MNVMQKKFRKLMLASSIALAAASIGGTAGADTVAQNVTEARQETQIWTTYALSPYLRAHDIKVAVHAGKATLTGNVDEGVNKDLAKQIALGVEGIKDVDNQIVVLSDYTPPVWSSTRTYGESIDDVAISTAVKSKLLWSKNTDGLTATVETRSGKVTLKGTADTAAASSLATRLAMNTRGVVAVDNQLVVNAPTPDLAQSAKNTVNAAEHDIKDSWITAKVKSTFMYSSHVEGSHIDVSTTNGIVTLIGKVDSGAERALAIELADNVRGVKQVQATGLVF